MATRKRPTGDEPRWLDAREAAAWFEVVGLMTRLPALLDAQLQRDAQLTHFEYTLLAALSAMPDRTQRMTALGELISASPSRLSHVVTRLEERGYVERSRCPGPGRATTVALTDAGRAKLAEAAPGHVRTVRELVIDLLDPDQLESLVAIGQRLRASLGDPGM